MDAPERYISILSLFNEPKLNIKLCFVVAEPKQDTADLYLMIILETDDL